MVFSVDLEHLRAVKRDAHQKFASENSMSSHFLSARTDDMVCSSVRCLTWNLLATMEGVSLHEQHWFNSTFIFTLKDEYHEQLHT